VAVTRQATSGEKLLLGFDPPTLAVAVATALRSFDCEADWDGSELTDEERAARPVPPWLPKMYTPAAAP